jgi:hypothetical protein
MTFSLTFSHINIEGKRIPSFDSQGHEVTLIVEADSKSSAMASEETRDFAIIQGNDSRIRGVS